MSSLSNLVECFSTATVNTTVYQAPMVGRDIYRFLVSLLLVLLEGRKPMLGYREYYGKAVGDVGCFLFFYAQCAAFFFDLIG